jgi:hypothetical protein
MFYKCPNIKEGKLCVLEGLGEVSVNVESS